MLTKVFALCLLYFSCCGFVLCESKPGGRVTLGKLHWCKPECLCFKESSEDVHCFSEDQIFELIGLDNKEIHSLQRIKWDMKEKVVWCNETCLCHPKTGKNFRCTEESQFETFFFTYAPHLLQFLEHKPEKFDVQEFVEEREYDGVTKHKETSQKNRKHHRKLKKHHRTEHDQEHERNDSVSINIGEQSSKYSETTKTTPGVLAAGFEPAEIDSGPVLSAVQDPLAADPEEPLIRDYASLSEKMAAMEKNISLNQQILFVALSVACLALIGMVLLVIRMCCTTRPSKKPPKKPQRTSNSHLQEKVKVDDAW